MSYRKKPLSLGELYDLYSEEFHYSDIKQMEGRTLEDFYYIDKLQPKEVEVRTYQACSAIQRLKNADTEEEVKDIAKNFFHIFISPYDISEDTTEETKYQMAYIEALKLWKKYKKEV